MQLDELNQLPQNEAVEVFARCCGSAEWVKNMLERRPYADAAALYKAAEASWLWLWEEHWLEAFSHHPKIGDIDSLRAKFATTRAWAEGEQSGVQSGSDDVLKALAAGNEAYEAKFGYIFIVCATGKKADEMLALLNARLKNDAATEIQLASLEQMKITQIRLEKLLL